MKFKKSLKLIVILLTILVAYLCARPNFSNSFFAKAAESKSNNQDHTILVTDNIYETEYYDLEEKKEYSEVEVSKEESTKEVSVKSQTSKIVRSNNSSNEYSKSDLELLAHLIFAEANVYYNKETKRYENCSDEWQCYVANVALNRVKSKSFPNTLRGVIYQKGQYASAWDGNFDRTPNQRAYDNALKVLKGYRPLPEKVVYQAEFKQGKGIYEKIGNTYFCYN